MKNARKIQTYKPLIAASLLVGGAFQLAAPVLAAPVSPVSTGTAAGTTISNTATATYEDEEGTTIDGTSNKVTITVAEVAGIEVTANGVTDSAPSPGETGVGFDFKVTNTGNDSTKFYIPDTGDITVDNGTATKVQISYDGTTWIDRPSNGITDPVAPGGVVHVRVIVTVSTNPNDVVKVTLGDDPNQTADNGAGDVRTRDNQTGDANNPSTGEADLAKAPVNGEQEDQAASSTATITASYSVLTGPKSSPDAVATTNNDDFTDASTKVPANTVRTTNINPDEKTITNTVRNTSDVAVDVSLLPVVPTNLSDLPDGTEVIITYGSKVAVYEYDNTGSGSFTWKSASSGGTSSAGTNATTPVKITSVQPGSTGDKDYTVTIDLPANTPQLVGYPVTIAAFLDVNNNGLFDDSTFNKTIDRLYTGYLELNKTWTVLPGNGPAVSDQNYAAPGNYIQYTITYTNKSTGTTTDATNGNVILNANNVSITEDGTGGGVGNNWANDQDSDGNMDTTHVSGSATTPNTTFTKSGGGTGANTDVDIVKYVHTVNVVAPGASGTFTFQREVNTAADTTP